MRKFVGVVLAMWLVSAFSISVALGTSFNCRPYLKRNKCPEVAICRDGFLSSQDEYMASLYFRVRRRLSGDLRNKFRDYQREWLAKRNGCGCNVYCLENAYKNQIRALTRTWEQM